MDLHYSVMDAVAACYEYPEVRAAIVNVARLIRGCNGPRRCRRGLSIANARNRAAAMIAKHNLSMEIAPEGGAGPLVAVVPFFV